jgi:hypothetical protein
MTFSTNQALQAIADERMSIDESVAADRTIPALWPVTTITTPRPGAHNAMRTGCVHGACRTPKAVVLKAWHPVSASRRTAGRQSWSLR